MPIRRRFVQCDVFTAIPTRGNALAVVVDGDGLSDDQMQAFARWTNLAETTFICAPTLEGADYQVRIFTPTREMPFAGHPTLGSCMTWLRAGGTPQQDGVVRQQCAIGLVEIDVSGPAPAFVAPITTLRSMQPAERQRIIDRLGLAEDSILAMAELENGPVWQVIELDSAETVLQVDSRLVRWPEFKAIGLIGETLDGSNVDYEVRMLAPSSGMSEDPITGSLASALACWLAAQGRLVDSMIFAQGRCVDRIGRVHIRMDARNRILIGGDVQFLIEGTLEL